MYILITCTVILLFTFVAFYLYAKYKQNYWARRGVFSPPANWFFGHFGNALLARTSVVSVLNDLSNYMGDSPVGFYVMQKPHLLLRNLDHIKAILVKDFQIFPDRYFAYKRKTDAFAIRGLTGISNPKWKQLRSKMSPHLAFNKLKTIIDIIIWSANNMRNHLANELSTDKLISINIKNIIAIYSTDFIVRFTLGLAINSFLKENSELPLRLSKAFYPNHFGALKWISNFFYPEFNEIFGIKLFGSQTEYLKKLCWESLNLREKSGIKTGDFVDTIISLKQESQKDSKCEIMDDEVVAQITAFLVAGTETSTTAIIFTLIELAKNPKIQEKVREEIREKLGNEELTYECISEMKYIEQVISETLRMYPTLPFINRVALKDYKLPNSNVVIEQGTVVYIDLHSLHRNSEYHINPLKYDPDRFSHTRQIDIKPLSYLPFGIGPRMCIAERVARLKVIIAVITIVREYQILENVEFNPYSVILSPSEKTALYFKKIQ